MFAEAGGGTLAEAGTLATADTIVRLGLTPGPTEQEVLAEERAERARRKLLRMVANLDLASPLTEDTVDAMRKLREHGAGAFHERMDTSGGASRDFFAAERGLAELELESLL